MLVHDIQQRSKIAGTGIGGVHAVVDRNEADAMLRKIDLREETSFQVGTANATEILDDHYADFAGLHICHELLPAGTIEVLAGVTIVGIMNAVGKALIGSKAGQQGLLVGDGIGITGQFIIA